jgi:hypothetical protein
MIHSNLRACSFTEKTHMQTTIKVARWSLFEIISISLLFAIFSAGFTFPSDQLRIEQQLFFGLKF